jgi:hypothetical protein
MPEKGRLFKYNFFSYNVNEALILFEDEERMFRGEIRLQSTDFWIRKKLGIAALLL